MFPLLGGKKLQHHLMVEKGIHSPHYSSEGQRRVDSEMRDKLMKLHLDE